MNRCTYLSSAVATVGAVAAVLWAGALPAQEPGPDVLLADSFESGGTAPDGWKQGANVPGVRYVYDRRSGSDGERSLCLQKSANRYFPIAGWSRIVAHSSQKPVLKVTAKVRASKVTKAVIDVLFLDAGGEWIKHEWAAYIGQKEPNDPPATHDWKTRGGALEIPEGTKRIGIAFQIYGPGRVWFDELEARYFDSLAAAKADEKADDPDGAGGQPMPEDSGSAAAEIPPPIEIETPSGAVVQYLLIPPAERIARPARGFPLLVVLPGGDGSASFHPFVRRIHEQALDGRFVVAQPLAPPQVVWPTQSSRTWQGTTEESLAAMIDDVAGRQPIDSAQVYALAWSSGGPAVYAAFLQERSPLCGALIAMSVFKPDQLPPLSRAAGRSVYLLHSPEDAICPHRMAEDAREQLSAAGARVALVDYSGGHGWHGPVYDNIREGIEWLQKQIKETGR